MDEIIFRYGLPGLPATLVVYTYSRSMMSNQNIDIFGIPIVIALALMMGYYIHQLWFLIFEISSASYSNKDRKVLNEITTIIRSCDKYKMFFYERDIYHIWDTMLYSDIIPKGIRDKDRGMWHSYHANAGNATGLIIGTVIIVIVEIIRLCSGAIKMVGTTQMICLGGFVLTTIVLVNKSKVTRRLVDGLEVYWANLYFEKYVNELLKGKIKDQMKKDK